VPRYFFHFERQDANASDLIGHDLPNDEAAKDEAAKLAADVGMSDAIEGQLPTFEWVEVVDEQQRPVARLPVRDAVREPNRST
jgi:hypothetical protein